MKERYSLDLDERTVCVTRDNFRGEIVLGIEYPFEDDDGEKEHMYANLNQEEARKIAEQLLVEVGKLKRVSR